MLRALIFIFLSLSAQAAVSDGYNGQKFRLQRKVGLQRIVQILVEQDPKSKAYVVSYNRSAHALDVIDDSKVIKTKLSLLKVVLDPLFVSQSMDKWPSDQHCTGKTQWVIVVGNQPKRIFCHSPEADMNLQKVMNSFTLLLQK